MSETPAGDVSVDKEPHHCPASWTRPTVITAALLVAAVVLIQTDIRVALSLLLGAAVIGAGVALAGGAIGYLLDGKAPAARVKKFEAGWSGFR
jgi:hypothetical protein